MSRAFLAPSVLFVDLASPWGGIEEHLLTLYRSLLANGQAVSILVAKNSQLSVALANEGLPYFSCSAHLFDSRNRRFQRTLRKPFLYRCILRQSVQRILKGGRSSIVICHKLWDAEALASLRTKFNFQIVLHECTHRAPPREVLVHADYFASMSPLVLSKVREEGTLPDRSCFFPPLFSLNERPVEQGAHNRAAFLRSLVHAEISAETSVICVLANLISYKGHSQLLDSLAVFARQCSRPWIAICAGSGPLERDLVEQAGRLGLGSRVFFPGFVGDRYEFLKHADALVLPSPNEGFGIALLEAATVGRPSIMSKRGGAAGVLVRHLETGFLFDPDDAGSLVECLNLALNDSSVRDSVVSAARAQVRQEYSIQKGLERFSDILKKLNEDATL